MLQRCLRKVSEPHGCGLRWRARVHLCERALRRADALCLGCLNFLRAASRRYITALLHYVASRFQNALIALLPPCSTNYACCQAYYLPTPSQTPSPSRTGTPTPSATQTRSQSSTQTQVSAAAAAVRLPYSAGQCGAGAHTRLSVRRHQIAQVAVSGGSARGLCRQVERHGAS